ncbi:MAG: endonuclease/exonuclease/phosphatase family protein [Phycisphaerales bacterium]
MSEKAERARGKGPRWWRAVRVVWKWLTTGLSAAGALACGVWMIAGLGREIDIAAQFVAQMCVGMALLMVWWAVWRAWGRMAIALTGVAIGALGVLPGRAGMISRERAEREGTLVRVLQINAYAQNTRALDAFETIKRSGADVIAIYEAPWQMLNAMRTDGAFHEAYPYFDLPAQAGTGFPVLVSKWPMERMATGPERAQPEEGEHGRSWRVDRPGGGFIASMIHPFSPRTDERWEAGNRVVRRAIEAKREHYDPTGLPMVFVGDLNSTPSGWRSRYLCGQGLARAKPWWVMRGTWPTKNPEWARIAIDDALLGPRVKVASWRALEAGGSDHAPVLMELAIPKVAGTGAGKASE